MKVTAVGRPSALSSYQAKWNWLPAEIELTLITPPQIKQTLSVSAAVQSKRWQHLLVSAWMTDRLSPFGFNPISLWQALKRVQPQLVHADEEPPSLAMLELVLLKRLLGFRLIFVTWENLVTDFTPPFNLVRRLTLKIADGAIAGNTEAAELLRRDGFQKPIAVIPLTATDTSQFYPRPAHDLRQALSLSGFTVGYVGRLVSEKGIESLIEALARLSGDWQGLFIGRGPQQPELASKAQKLGIAERLVWLDTVSYDDMPRYLNAMDVLVLPSLTTRRWKEQFGRVLAEAMACEVAVIGSDSGSIPEVIGDAGLIFPEANAETLARHLQSLSENDVLRRDLGRQGRQRILANYTNERVAERVVAFWREMIMD